MPRFYHSPQWKHILTTRQSLQVSDLSKLASNRTARFELGGPSWVQGFVPSHDFRVAFPWDDNFASANFDPWYVDYDPYNPFASGTWGYPRLAEGVRLMYSFRREAEIEGEPWVIRHAGPVLELEDNADPDRRLSRFTAFDPWAYLYQRPCRLFEPVTNLPKPDLGSIPGEKGVVFPVGTTGDEMVCELLRRTIEEDGLTYIDAGVAFGGTAFYTGTIETTCDFLDPTIFPRGTSVGTAWETLMDTGTLDIVLTPIWDPFNRPGYCAELNVYNTAGGDPNQDVLEGYPMFAWDRIGRSLIGMSRLQDGRERANRIRAYSGGTGAANAPWTEYISSINAGDPADEEASWDDSASSVRYGESWHEQTFLRQSRLDYVGRQARNELIRRREGQRTWSFAPTPEYSPRPFQDYMPGTWCSFYHSERMRQEQWWIPNNFNDQEVYPRIFGFDLAMSDDALETVTALDITLDIEPADC